MGTIRVNGSTSGYVELAAPAVAGSTALTLPLGGFGKVLQVVFASDGTSTTSTSTTFADTGLSATITPTLNTSKVLVIVTIAGTQKSANTARMGLKLLRTATDLITFWTDGFDNGSVMINVGTQATTYLDSPATTSATTYKTQFALSAGTSGTVITESGATSTMILMEVAA